MKEKEAKIWKAYIPQDSGKQETEDEMQRWIQAKGACQDLNCYDLSKATGLDGSSAHCPYPTAAGYQHIRKGTVLWEWTLIQRQR